MNLKKNIIKKKIEELYLQGWLGLLTVKEYNNLLYRVRFLSEKDTNIWYNALFNYEEFVKVREFYAQKVREFYNH